AFASRARERPGAPPARAHQIEGPRAGDGGEPGPHAAAAGVELARRPPRLAERIRHDLFGVGPLPRDRDRQRVQRGAVTIVQLAQRAVVARRHALHKRAVRLAGHGLELVLTRGVPQRTLECYGAQTVTDWVYFGRRKN